MRFLTKKIAIRIPQSPFFRNVGVMIGGTALSQALLILVAPLLTRLYSPTEFGTLAIFTSILGIMSTFSSGCFELGIPLAREEGEARRLTELSALILLSTVGLVILASWIVGWKFCRWIHAESLHRYIFLVPIGMIGVGSYQILNFWTTRRKQFGLITRTRLVQSVGQASAQSVGGLLGLGAPGLIGGYLLSQFLGIGSLFHKSNLWPMKFDPKGWVSVAKTYRKFPIFSMWAALCGSLGIQLPVLLLGKLFTIETAGYYSLTMRLMGLPVFLIGQAVAQVFYPSMAEIQDDPEAVKNLAEKTVISLFFISFCIFGFIGLNATFLIPKIFGYKWALSGNMAVMLVPWFTFWLVSSPISSVLLVKNRQGTALGVNILEMIARVVAIWLGSKMGSQMLAIGFLSFVGVLISICSISWVLFLSGSSLLKLIAKFRSSIFIGVVLIGTLAVMRFGLIINRSWWSGLILIISFICIGIYGIWIMRWIRAPWQASKHIVM